MSTRIPQDPWKYVYKKLEEGEIISRRQVQDIDNGFFEKFGSMQAQQASLKAALEESTPLSPLEEIQEDGEQKADTEPYNYEKSVDRYIEAFGWNIDELYQEILYEILHNVGGCEVGQLAMLSYVQEAFKIANEKHTQLLKEAEAKEPPELILNVEIVEAKDLPSTDPNGLSDPFVAIFMSNSTHRYNSSVKQATLNPVWKEHFSLDFDPAETVKVKMAKLSDVKGVGGLGRFLKEIAITATTGKDVNELIGSAVIPVNSIPSGGITELSVSLRKKKKWQRGLVKVRLNFSPEKDSQVAAQEHRHLLRILLLHELENSKVAPYWWSGSFSAPAETILAQHAAQTDLSQQDINLAQWFVFCAVTTDHPLSFSIFNKLLDKMLIPIKSGLMNEEDVTMFWDGAKKLLPACYSHIRKLRIMSLRGVLKILLQLCEIDFPETVDLFPTNLYGWLKGGGEMLTIQEVLQQAVSLGASDWFAHILDNYKCNEKTEGSKLQHLIILIKLVYSDLQRADKYYEGIFVEIVNFSFIKILYRHYESEIAALVEPQIKEMYKSLKQLHYKVSSKTSEHSADGINEETVVDEMLAMGTKLFDLYRTLQWFLELSQHLNKTDSCAITKFHSWFFEVVVQWLEIAAYKALKRIEKAVELDSLIQVDNTVKYSSSSVDTLTIFVQIKTFWQDLAWPDTVESYMFLTKIVDDLCRCLVYYSGQMASRVDNIGTETTVYGEKFEVTTEWCVAINNIDHLRHGLGPFVETLGMEDIVQRLSEMKSPADAQKCKDTMEKVIENAMDTMRNKTTVLLMIMVKKMMPTISRYLVEGTELLHQDCSSMKRIMEYLEANLNTVNQNLSEENFSQTLDIVWDQLGKVLDEWIQANVEKSRPPSFFTNLHKCLKIMIRSFRQENKEFVLSETLQRVEYLLQIHGMETRDLIHRYHLERCQEQQAITEPKMGILTVRAQFINDSLKIEIMNARNLTSTDSNGSDSYVQAMLLPEGTFTNTEKPKTRTHSKNLFPLYDEVFTIPLTHEQRNAADGLLHFVIKNKDMFSNAFVGEAYLHFSEVPDTLAPISSLPQNLLTLTRPASIDGDTIKALESRRGDKQAREFLKKQRQKMPSTKPFFSLV